MALIPEEMLLEEGHAGHHAGFPASGERVKLELRRYEGGCKLGVRRSTGTSAPNLGRNIMQLLAVLVSDDGTTGGTGVGCDLSRICISVMVLGLGRKLYITDHNAPIVYTSDDGGTCAGGFW